MAVANISSSPDNFHSEQQFLTHIFFKPEVLSLMYFSFSLSGSHFCNLSKLLASTVSSEQDREEDHVTNQLLFFCFKSAACWFYSMLSIL